MNKRWILGAALALALAATPAAAAEPAGRLNQPGNLASAGETGYTSDRLIAPLLAPRPAGDLKKVTRGGYSFQMPTVWQLPEGSAKAAFDGVLSAREQEVSGVAFFTFSEQNPKLPADLTVETYLAPIGAVCKATGKIENKAGAAKIVLYYPAQTPKWGIAAVTVGEDLAPTAEETAAYMVYTMAKER